MPHYTIVETPYGLRPEPVEQTHLGIWIFSRGRYTYNFGKSVNPREIFDSFDSARAAIAERQAACRHQWLNYANGRQCKSCRLWQEKTKEEKNVEKKKKQKREARRHPRSAGEGQGPTQNHGFLPGRRNSPRHGQEYGS